LVRTIMRSGCEASQGLAVLQLVLHLQHGLRAAQGVPSKRMFGVCTLLRAV
jgi:hypothetical protein